MKAFDTADITTGYAHELYNLGYRAVGIYLRSDRAPIDMVKGLLSVGMMIFSIWEKGHPTSDDYFTAEQGSADGQAAAAYAAKIGQPAGTQIFTCFDYDPSIDAINGGLHAYMVAFRVAVKSYGYLASAYGSGTLLAAYTNEGICHSGYITQSTGFSGYEDFKPKASIVQGESTTLHMADGHDFDVDLDTIVDSAACWKLAA
jgi:hypothetical protein